MNNSAYAKGVIATAYANLLASATLLLYAAPQPATPDTSTALTPLAALPLANVTAQAAAVSFTCPEQAAESSGIAAWARIVSGANTICDLTAGVSGSGADIILTAAQIWQGGFVSITSAQINVQ